YGVVLKIAEQLDLTTDFPSWWEARERVPLAERFSMFFEQVALAEVPKPIVVFVDEIDQTLGMDFTDDFFTAIRSLHFARAPDLDFKRLSFVLLGAATPAALVKNPAHTPFNIG